MTAVEMKKPDTVCLEEKTSELEEAFLTSSHFTRWLFPTTKEVRQRRWQVMVESLKDEFAGDDGDDTTTDKEERDISEEEYFDYCLRMCEKCLEVCETFGLSERVQWTAVILLKRSLLQRSVLEWSSQACLIGCVALIAAKSEGCVIALADLAKVFRQSSLAKELIDSEMQLLASLNFDLRVWQALPPLRSLCSDFCKFVSKRKGQVIASALRTSLQTQSEFILSSCLVTDSPLVHTPAQMALACFLLAASNTKGLKQEALPYFDALFAQSMHATKLRRCTEIIQSLIIEKMNHTERTTDAGRLKVQAKIDRLRRDRRSLKDKQQQSSQKKKRTLTDSAQTDHQP